MTTGYHLSLGYKSGYTFRGTEEEAWDLMKRRATEICNDPDRILTAARKFNAPEKCGCGSPACEGLEGYANHYKEQINADVSDRDATILFIEKDREVQQLASTHGSDRAIKEHVRRAFCRLLIYEMHMLGIEVNLIIA